MSYPIIIDRRHYHQCYQNHHQIRQLLFYYTIIQQKFLSSALRVSIIPMVFQWVVSLNMAQLWRGSNGNTPGAPLCPEEKANYVSWKAIQTIQTSKARTTDTPTTNNGQVSFWFGVTDSHSYSFYRAMHFSAKRGIAIACRLSVCPSGGRSVVLWGWWIVIT